jgi:integrase
VSHPFKRDGRIPEWHGWHAARRGLGSKLYRVGVPDIVIQRILRQANVSTTASYYIKTAADDVRSAMGKLEQNVSLMSIRDTFGTVNDNSRTVPASVN